MQHNFSRLHFDSDAVHFGDYEGSAREERHGSDSDPRFRNAQSVHWFATNVSPASRVSVAKRSMPRLNTML